MNEKKVLEIDIDEALEILWTLEEEGKRDRESFKRRYGKKMDEDISKPHKKRFRHGYRDRVSEEVIDRLVDRDMVELENGDIRLTREGRRVARDIVRRHRLAERMMVDIFSMGKHEVEKPACEFEHVLSEEVTERICTLLGHPRECPHGMPIPRGKCCKSGRETIKPAIKPLSRVDVGERVEIAYIHTEDHSRLHKLLSYDIGPSSIVEVHQKKPVYVIRAGETDIALERKVIDDIFVKNI